MPGGSDDTARELVPTAPSPFGRELLVEMAGLRRFVRSLRITDGDVDDVVQETLARAWRSRDAFDHARPLGAWLRKIAVRAWIDQRRPPGHAVARLPDALADGRADPGALRHDLAACLARLPAIERSLVLRFHRDRQSLQEIASETGMPLNTVKSHLHRARRKLAAGEQP